MIAVINKLWAVVLDLRSLVWGLWRKLYVVHGITSQPVKKCFSNVPYWHFRRISNRLAETWTIEQLSLKPQISECRSSPICAVVELITNVLTTSFSSYLAGFKGVSYPATYNDNYRSRSYCFAKWQTNVMNYHTKLLRTTVKYLINALQLIYDSVYEIVHCRTKICTTFPRFCGPCRLVHKAHYKYR